MRRASVHTGDITKLRVAAIVNAANELMLGGGGVDGAIHRAAGPSLLAACRELPLVRPGVRCPTGEARLTPGYQLPASFVIHTVGPVWRGGQSGEPELLARCYRTCLELAMGEGITSIAFPAISCGVYGFPRELGCELAVREVQRFLHSSPEFEQVIFVAFDSELAGIWQRALARVLDGERARVH